MLRMPRFEVREPATLEEALALLAQHPGTARPIAGGTDVLPNLKHRLLAPELLVSLARLHVLRGVAVEADGGLRLGAMATLDEVATHPEVLRRGGIDPEVYSSFAFGIGVERLGTIAGLVGIAIDP